MEPSGVLNTHLSKLTCLRLYISFTQYFQPSFAQCAGFLPQKDRETLAETPPELILDFASHGERCRNILRRCEMTAVRQHRALERSGMIARIMVGCRLLIPPYQTT